MQNKTIAFSITPKGVMNEIHHHIFLSICNVWRRNCGYLWSGRPQGIAPTDKYHQMYFVTIMHSALIMTRTSALTMTRTSVRLYVVQSHISSDKSHQMYFPIITNYALWFFEKSRFLVDGLSYVNFVRPLALVMAISISFMTSIPIIISWSGMSST